MWADLYRVEPLHVAHEHAMLRGGHVPPGLTLDLQWHRRRRRRRHSSGVANTVQNTMRRGRGGRHGPYASDTEIAFLGLVVGPATSRVRLGLRLGFMRLVPPWLWREQSLWWKTCWRRELNVIGVRRTTAVRCSRTTGQWL
jgi:hypothetical protein